MKKYNKIDWLQSFIYEAALFTGKLDFFLETEELREDLETFGYSIEDARELRIELMKIKEIALTNMVKGEDTQLRSFLKLGK